jgi:type I restriction enzyme S subunit
MGRAREPLYDGPIIIFARIGSNCGATMYSAAPCWINNNATGIRGKPGTDTRFLYYWMQSFDFALIREGSGQPFISQATLDSQVLRLPPLTEQRTIAHILGTLDDKIELNRRMSETLEQIARAIFKAWFVDFEPVRAKMEGRWRRGESLPGLPGHLYDLFPDRLVDSELGEIPEGWEVKKLSDLCSTQYGYTASAVDRPVGPHFLRVTDINKRNWIEWHDVPFCQIDPSAKEAYSLRIGDIVVARMADPGKAAIVEDEVDAVFASYLVRLKTKSLAYSYYVYGFLKSDLYLEYVQGVKSGSVQPTMNAKVIVGASLAIPPVGVIDYYLKAIFPLRKRLVRSIRESRTLAALRDALLPKLIRGEVRVKDVERFLEERAL